MIMRFKKPVDVSVDRLSASAPAYISAARIDPDGTAVRIALQRPLKVHAIPAAEQLYVDLLPEKWTGVLPGLPQRVIENLARRAQEAEQLLHRQQIAAKARKPRFIRVRVASQPTFTRYVFDVPDGVNVVPDKKPGRLVLDFDQKIKWDLADAIATMPSTVASIKATTSGDTTAVAFSFKGEPRVHTFREDSSIAVDIGHGGVAPRRAGPDAAGHRAAADRSGERQYRAGQKGRGLSGGFAEDRRQTAGARSPGSTRARQATRSQAGRCQAGR